MLFSISDAQAATEAATTAPDPTVEVPEQLSAGKMMQDNLMLLGLIFFIFYFMLIRPQQKRLKAHRDMMKSLQKGNKVITGGGLIGTIVKFEGDDVVVLEVAQGVKLRVTRSSIAEIKDGSGAVETANDN